MRETPENCEEIPAKYKEAQKNIADIAKNVAETKQRMHELKVVLQEALECAEEAQRNYEIKKNIASSQKENYESCKGPTQKNKAKINEIVAQIAANKYASPNRLKINNISSSDSSCLFDWNTGIRFACIEASKYEEYYKTLKLVAPLVIYLGLLSNKTGKAALIAVKAHLEALRAYEKHQAYEQNYKKICKTYEGMQIAINESTECIEVWKKEMSHHTVSDEEKGISTARMLTALQALFAQTSKEIKQDSAPLSMENFPIYETPQVSEETGFSEQDGDNSDDAGGCRIK